MFNIFISATHEDLERERTAVCEHITALGLNCIAMEKWPAAANPSIKEINKALKKADIFVGIIAWKYGSKVVGDNSFGDVSFTEYEFRYAKNAGLPRLIFLLDPNQPWPPSLVDRGMDGMQLDRFRKEIETDTEILWKPFRTTMELVNNLSGALFSIVKDSKKFNSMDEEEKEILKIRQLVGADFIARRSQISSGEVEADHKWLIHEISRCNVGERYIVRRTVRRSISDWLLRNHCPYFFVTGPAGIGKTNFLIMELVRYIVGDTSEKPGFSQQAVIFITAGSYDLRRTFWENIVEYMARSGLTKESVSHLIQVGKGVIVLDGVDEFVRNHGENEAAQLFSIIDKQINHEKSKIVISCRHHIYKLLEKKGILQNKKDREHMQVPVLSPIEVKIALRNRLGESSPGFVAVASNEALVRFAQKPLLLEMMCRISRDGWKRLVASQNLGRLYELWFEEIIATGADALDIIRDEFTEVTNMKVGKIAGLMLKKRSDLVSEAELEENQIPLSALSTLTRQPFGLFIKQTPTEWSFVHDSFREFALAKTIATEFASSDFSLLANTSSFDYVGAETFQFLRDILPESTTFFEQVERTLEENSLQPEGWNNIVRNSFEAIGMIGEETEELFIEKAVSILSSNLGFESSHEKVSATTKTKYNLARALERMHRSSPRPYYQHVMSKAWASTPSWHCFGATAIRGFHASEPYPSPMPPMVYKHPRNNSDNFMQREVSHVLIELIRESLHANRTQQEEFLEINASYALIRWLHGDHLDSIKSLLHEKLIKPCSKGNLFQAFLRFGDPQVLSGCSELFRGMEISWIYLSRSMVPNDFCFLEVVIDRYGQSIITGLPPIFFFECKYNDATIET